MIQALAKIKWLYLARLFSLIGSQILFFAVPLLIFRLTHSVMYTGIAFSLEWTARTISFPLSGYCADHYGSKRVYILTDMMVGVLCLLTIIMIALFPSHSVFILILLSVIAGFLSEQGYVSAESLAPKLVNVTYYPQSQSVLELLELLALLFGPFLAGIFILYFKLEHLVLVAMVFYVFSAVAMSNIKVDFYPAIAKLNFVQDLAIGVNTVLNQPYLIRLVMLAMLSNLLFGLMLGSAPIMVAGIYQKTDQLYAVLNLTAGAFGAITIVLFNYILKFTTIEKIGTCAFLIACLSCILLVFSHSYITYLFMYAFFYAASGSFSIFFRSERARVIPHDVLGRTIGTIIFITFILFPISGVLISISQKLFGLQHMVMLLGMICLFLGVPILKNIYSYSSEYGKDPI